MFSNNTQSESYAGKAKKNLSKKEKTADDQTNSIFNTNELIKSLMPLFTSLISEIIKKVITDLPTLLNNLNVN
jgi:hypothetical protein